MHEDWTQGNYPYEKPKLSRKQIVSTHQVTIQSPFYMKHNIHIVLHCHSHMYTEKELESEEDDVDEEGQEYLKMLAKKVRC